MADQFTSHYKDLLEGCYDCVDRIVLNAYLPRCWDGGGFRHWWRLLYGSDERLDNEHLMRMAGRFSRRLRAWAKANQVAVVDCGRGEKKHLTAEEYMATHPVEKGLFLILVGRAPAPVWDVQLNHEGKIRNIERKKTWPYVNHYFFHIMDPDWGHVTIRMCGHPPFPAQVILNGHEYVACQARAKKGKGKPIEFIKEDNCFTHISNAAGLEKIADTLRSDNAAGLLKQVCERWIYSTCLCFALDLEEQQRSGFGYEYSSFQIEYSRNLQFRVGGQMEQVFQSLIDRTRATLDLNKIKTILGYKKRPCRKTLREGRYEVIVETPEYGLTVFKVHYGKLTLKIYTKGECVLRIEAIVHNTKELKDARPLEKFTRVVEQLHGMVERFLDTIHYIDACFIADRTLERLPAATLVGKTKVGGIDYNKPRTRLVMQSVLALSTSPKGFSASDVATKVRAIGGPSTAQYHVRQAAYDLKKFRGKEFVRKVGKSRRYEPTPSGLRAMACLFVLREKVIKPLLAASCQTKRGARPVNPTPIDQHYEAVSASIKGLFAELGICA